MLLGLWHHLDFRHHNRVEFLVSVFPSSAIALSKVYIRGTSNKAIILQSCFLDVLFRHSNIVAGKGSNLFNECDDRCVHLSPQEKVCTFSYWGTVKCTYRTP